VIVKQHYLERGTPVRIDVLDGQKLASFLSKFDHLLGHVSGQRALIPGSRRA
jgi:hypothetical protein